MSSITLGIASLSVTLDRFTSDDCPRIRGQIGGITYSAAGTAIGNGTVYEPKHIWDVSVVCTETQMQLLKVIFAEHDRSRRSLTACDLTVADTTELYEERYPRTRAIVGGTTQINIPTTTPTHCLYFAQFKAWFGEAPKFTAFGAGWLASFTLLETDGVAA